MADGFVLLKGGPSLLESILVDSFDLHQLERAMVLASGSRKRKILSQPWRLGYSKFLEVIARATVGGRHATTRTFWNQPMQVVLPERVSLTLHRYGFFEGDLTQAFIQLLRPGMVFFDIGAHIGYFSLLASKLVGPNGMVHSFEPTPTTFALLRRNTFEINNITTVNAAVYSEEGEIKLHDFGVTFSAFNSIYAGKMQENERQFLQAKEYEARCTTLAAHITQTGVKPDVVKIDAEGAELKILEGLEPILTTCRPILTLEVGDISGSQASPPSRPVVDWLLAHGYRPTEFSEGKFLLHRPRQKYMYSNLVCFPAD